MIIPTDYVVILGAKLQLAAGIYAEPTDRSRNKRYSSCWLKH